MTRRIVGRQSLIHGRGVFAATDIVRDTRIATFRGKRLTHAQANRRFGNDVESGHTFLFTLNDNYVLDTNDGGNLARWINHSCDPNAQSWVIGQRSDDPKRDIAVIETSRDIREGEEVTFDYGIVLNVRHTSRLKRVWACHCGARNCLGTMLRPKQRRSRHQ